MVFSPTDCGNPPRLIYNHQEHLMLMLLIAIAAVACFISTAFALSLYDIFFTQMDEGTFKAVVKSGSFDHILFRWKGHYQNDPRRRFYDPTFPAWEVYELSDQEGYVSAYAPWQIHWRFLEHYFGIYWYGLYPFKKIYIYEFKWAEHQIGEDGKSKPRYRDEYTRFGFVKNFTYWIRLQGAEDVNNLPLDLDYLLTVRITNGYKALFGIDDWLGRTTADANNDGKIYVGCSKFDELKKESKDENPQTSDFAERMLKLNSNIVTEPGAHGTKMSYGITITAASLVDVNPSGKTSAEVQKALSAKRVAELEAEAEAARGKGRGDAAEAEAKGEAAAIKKVYDTVQGYGAMGVTLQQLDAIKQAAKSPGATVIWANDPIGGLAAAIQGAVARPQPHTPPPATPTPSAEGA